MPNWPRTVASDIIVPVSASWPRFPTGLVAPGQTGRAQLRTTGAVGRRWSETYGPLKRSKASTQGFLALVNQYWHQQTLVDIDHRGQRNPVGTLSGTPLVNGVSQTGSSLITDGWTISITNIVRAGDVIKIAGSALVYDITADANSNGSGQATISISPPIFVGASPADDAAITTNNVVGTVLYRARIESVDMPQAGPNEFYVGLTVHFVEQP